MKPTDAFLQAIRDDPDDDTHRLVFADWLDENGDPARAELIRAQCQLARLPGDDLKRPPLVEREKAILEAHQPEWTDLAFAEWLGHRKPACRNPLGHDFCKLVAQGIRARCERDRLPEGDARRKRLDRKLKRLGEDMEGDFNYNPGTADMSLFESLSFHRGFVEAATVQDWAIELFADALPVLEVIRDLEIENDTTIDGMGDRSFLRLVPVLDHLRLRTLSSHAPIETLEVVQRLADSPGMRHLEELSIWFEDDVDPSEAVQTLADSPFLTGLRVLDLEHAIAFNDASVQAVLESPGLAGLTRCTLRPGEGQQRISPPLVERFRQRFGKDPADWR